MNFFAKPGKMRQCRASSILFPLNSMKPPKLNKNQLAAAGVFSALSGALALYLVKRPGLRKKLTKSNTPADALKAFGEHVQKDSNQFAKSLRDFATRSLPTRKSAERMEKKMEKKIKHQVKRAAKKGAATLEKVAAEME